MGLEAYMKLIRKKGERPHNLAESEDVRGLTGVVDASILLNWATRTSSGAVQLHHNPPRPVTEVASKFDQLRELANKNDITLLVVLDGGYADPRKAPEALRRSKLHAKALGDFAAASKHFDAAADEKADSDARTKLLAAQKKTAHPRSWEQFEVVRWCLDNKVQYVVAPVQADHECVSLVARGLADFVITTDGDISVLAGAPGLKGGLSMWIVDDLDLNSGGCCIFRLDRVIGEGSEHRVEFFQNNKTAAWKPKDLSIYGSIRGCDNIGDEVANHLHGIGEAAAIRLTNKYISAGGDAAKKAVLADIEKKYRWGAGQKGSKAEGYATQFEQSVANYRHGPCWKYTFTDILAITDEGKRKAFRDGKFTVELSTLTPLPANKTFQDMLGYDPSTHFEDAALNLKRAKGVVWRGDEPLSRPPLHHAALGGKAYGSEINWGGDVDKTLRMLDDAALYKYCETHHVRMAGGTVRSELESQCRRISELELDKKINVMTESEAQGDMVDNYAYSVNYTIDQPVLWNVDRVELAETIQTGLMKIDKTYIDRHFLGKYNGVRKRTLLLVKNGHPDLRTLKMTNATLDKCGTAVIIIAANIVGSLNSKEYEVALAFNAATGDFIGAPSSCCQCPAGRLFCSHMLALLLLLYLIQRLSNVTLDDLIASLPEPIKLLRATPIALSYLCNCDPKGKASKEKRLLKRISKLVKEMPTTPASLDDNGELLIPKDDGTPTIDVCTKLFEWVLTLKARAEASGEGELLESSLRVKALQEFNADLVEDFANPTATFRTEQRQLLLDLYEFYQSGELTRGGIAEYIFTNLDYIRSHWPAGRDSMEVEVTDVDALE